MHRYGADYQCLAPSRFEGASPFFLKCLSHIALPPKACILDIPCGFGRHAIWLAKRGYCVVGADIDRARLNAVHSYLTTATRIDLELAQFDAERPWPVQAESFDLVVIVDYVSEHALAEAHLALRSGGYLIFQTFGARGSNWQSLPNLGDTEALIYRKFKSIFFVSGRQAQKKTVRQSSCSHKKPAAQDSERVARDAAPRHFYAAGFDFARRYGDKNNSVTYSLLYHRRKAPNRGGPAPVAQFELKPMHDYLSRVCEFGAVLRFVV